MISSTSHFLFLLAGAGSGKTRTIVEKIRHLISNKIALKSEILAITFTKKATQEMLNRIGEREINISTFHSFCYRELREYHNKDYELITEDELPFSREILLDISIHKNSLKSTRPPLMYRQYQEHLHSQGKIDYDDLELMLLELLNSDADYKKKNQKKFRYIFVDEFQDTNELQYEILKKIVSPDSYMLAVGDPDQSIYGFRGANPKIINRYIKEYKAEVLLLDTNYRSNDKIISIANRVISKNKDRIEKTIYGKNTAYGSVFLKRFGTKEVETTYIMDEIKKHISDRLQYGEIAILFRNHYFARSIIERLSDSYIPYQYNEDCMENKIQCLTIHQAKGLEFEVVFLIGLEEGNFPMNTDNRISELYEERRLFFVAITRAKRFLYISCSKRIDGNLMRPSSFLRKI